MWILDAEADVYDAEIFSTTLICCANAEDISNPPPATQKLASVELCLLQLEQLASTLPPPQPAVASLQGVSQVGVHPQYTNANNPALQQLKQRN